MNNIQDILDELTNQGISHEYDTQDQAYLIWYKDEYGRLYSDDQFKIEYDQNHYIINNAIDVAMIANLMITKSNESLDAKKITELILALDLK